MNRAEAIDVLVDVLASTRDDPVEFARLFLPAYGQPWHRQAEMLRSVVRYRSTVVYTGNAVGKSHATAILLLWWLLTRPDALVIVTGASQTTIGSIVWKQVRRALDGAVLPFGGGLSQGIKASPAVVEIAPGGWQALGFSTTGVERASGQHAGSLLVIADEASAIETPIWEAVDSLGYERLFAIGNPIRNDGVFIDLIRQAEADRRDGIRPEEAVNAIQIPSTDSPHAELDRSPWGLADRTWLESMRRRYGEQSLWYRSHVKAEVPDAAADVLVEPHWLDAAFALPVRPVPGPFDKIAASRRIACDLAEGVGRDSTCIMVTDEGGVLECEFGSFVGLPEAAAAIARLARKWRVPPERISYDMLGIGKNMRNHLAQHGLSGAIGYAASGRPRDPRAFVNLRAEAGWTLRNRLDVRHVQNPRRAPAGTAGPFHFAPGPYRDRLREELAVLTYHLVGNRTALSSKEDWCIALGHSPDVADCLIQSQFMAMLT